MNISKPSRINKPTKVIKTVRSDRLKKVEEMNADEKIPDSVVYSTLILHSLGDTLGFKNGEWEFNTKHDTYTLDYTNEVLYEFLDLGGVNSIDLTDWYSSDDTIFHIYVAKAMLEYKGELTDSFINKFKYYLEKAEKKTSDSKIERYIGYTTKQSITNFTLEHDARYDEYNENGGGNGCAMRNLVIGLCLYEEKKLNELIDVSIVTSQLTHNNAIGYLGGFTAAYFTSLAVRKVDILKWPYLLIDRLNSDYLSSFIKKTISDETQDYLDFKNMWLKHIDNRFDEKRKLRDIRAFKNPMYRIRYYNSDFNTVYRGSQSTPQIGSSGYLAMIMAYDAVLDADGVWEKLILYAILNMGDSDTVGAIAGGLFGAYYGFSDTPQKMYEKLEFKEDIMKVSDSIKKKFF